MMGSGIVERAYELAKSGGFQSLDGIKSQLRAEGYNQFEVRDTFEGSALRQSLRQLCKDARSPHP
jgi:hypothetical protein